MDRLFLVASFMADNPKEPRPMPTLPLPSKTRCPMQFIVVLFALTIQSLAHAAQPSAWIDDSALEAGCSRTAVLFSVSLVAPAASSGIFESKSSTSRIVDFSPTSFAAKATAKFFYSIDNELKYADQIDPHAATLTRGPITNFLVSPDGNKIAVVVRKRLLIVGTDSVLGEVAEVDSIYRRFKPIGRRFFRANDFQWSRDSKSLYLIRDEYYHSRGSQLLSVKGELWRYDLDSRSLHLMLKPFAAHSYFFGPNFGIYYSEPTDRGDLQLKFFNGRNSTNIGKPNSSDILELSDGSDEGPFYSFSITDYEKALPSLNVRLVDRNGLKDLIIKDKKYLSVTQGYYWLEGYYYCTELLRSVFLPGDRFFLLNVPSCGNYKGQLLFELESARYQELPPNTVVFSTLNTMTFKRYRVTAGGIELK
ncbi:MAG: hypothetical protein ACXV78_07720 [Candidatus Angelobacter sp.]